MNATIKAHESRQAIACFLPPTIAAADNDTHALRMLASEVAWAFNATPEALAALKKAVERAEKYNAGNAK